MRTVIDLSSAIMEKHNAARNRVSAGDEEWSTQRQILVLRCFMLEHALKGLMRNELLIGPAGQALKRGTSFDISNIQAKIGSLVL